MKNYLHVFGLAAAALIGTESAYAVTPQFRETAGMPMELKFERPVDILSGARFRKAGIQSHDMRWNGPSAAGIRAAANAPSSVGMVDDGNAIILSWKAVAGASGYTIYEAGATTGDAKKLGTATGTSFTISRSTDTGEGAITLFGVSATVDGVESPIAPSPVLTTGEIAPLPWTESFRNGQTDKFFWTERTSDQQWGLLTDASGLASIDGDNGLFAFMALEKGDYIKLHTGKIALAGNSAPTLVFHRYFRPTQDVSLTVVASFPDGTSAEVFRSVNTGSAAAYWKSEIVDLAAYKAYRYCTLSFEFRSNDTFPSGGALVALDGLRIIDNKNVDVAAELSLPSRIMKGQTLDGQLDIVNNSLNTTPSLRVNIQVNGTTVVDGPLSATLGALNRGVLPFSVPTTSLMEGDVLSVSAKVTAEGDEVPQNNETTVQIPLEQTWRNPVGALRASRTPDNSMELQWEAPARNSRSVTDGFEDYAPWATEFGEWTTADIDLAFHGGVFATSDYPGQNEQFAFKVMTPEEIGETNNARGGRSYLGGIFGVYDDPDEGATYAASDAWLISPELSGEAHTASFFAASTPAWNSWWEKFDQTDETFYILYSTAGNSVADFRDYCYAGSISNKKIVDDEHYVKIEFSVPEGAHYFAIHHTTPAGDGCMLRIDDFSYMAGGAPVGYNVYADGEKLADGTELSFVDKTPQADRYAVTAVYRDGSESSPVFVDAAPAGIDMTVTGPDNKPFDIYNLQGVMVRRGVVSLDGLNLPAGIYIAKGHKFIIR